MPADPDHAPSSAPPVADAAEQGDVWELDDESPEEVVAELYRQQEIAHGITPTPRLGATGSNLEQAADPARALLAELVALDGDPSPRAGA